ncbi:hypothetical protein AOQ84DRAFT_375161 [Glonium stellatum]|uniref:Uncharacterized protein n=1 Tax=Glonium stellatum TaxID=574774 RepID=A0A8E2F4W8_9PEZI|nr:hypothetical protein AOQ84DRAFT_375161 [Glonium stellatum]
MATQQALCLPEIVSNILRQVWENTQYCKFEWGVPVEYNCYFERNGSLMSCILVNKLWAAEGTNIIWGEKEDDECFTSVDGPRLQYYANKIREIRIRHNKISQPVSSLASIPLSHLHFPRLSSLTLKTPFNAPTSELIPFLTPRLRTIKLVSSKPSEMDRIVSDIWPLVKKYCPRLERMVFSNLPSGGRKIPADELVSFLSAMPSINDVNLNSAKIELTLPLFMYLAQRPLIYKLSLFRPGFFGKEMATYETLRDYLVRVDTRQTQNSSPFWSHRPIAHPIFPHLEVLKLMSPVELFGALQSHISRIKDLKLRLWPYCGSSDLTGEVRTARVDYVLSCSSRFADLRRLEVHFASGAGVYTENLTTPLQFQGGSLLKLAEGCRSLEVLHLTGYVGLNATGLSDEVIDKAAKLLPRLSSLLLQLDRGSEESELTERTLQSLGRHCRRMKVCRIRAPINLLLQTDENCLFPRLCHLAVGARTQVDYKVHHSEVNALQQVLLHHFPALVFLDSWRYLRRTNTDFDQKDQSTVYESPWDYETINDFLDQRQSIFQ